MAPTARRSPLRLFTILPLAAVLAGLVYLTMRTVLFLGTDLAWYDKAVAAVLLVAEGFMLVHGFGYLLEIGHVWWRGRGGSALREVPPMPDPPPPVAIIISSYHEPLAMLEQTLTALGNLTYPNRTIYFLDDTRYDRPGDDPDEMRQYREAIDALCRRHGTYLFRRHWHGAKAGMVNDFLRFLRNEYRDGFEFYNYSDSENWEPEAYLVLFDADINPLPGFVEPLVERMESDPRLAFVQTPQYYSNFEENRVARAAGLMQAVFYEYICEGKSLKDAVFCCGTNVIFRIEALRDVGGLDESSVTEDFATSVRFHQRGWHSSYYNRILAFGRGPEDLGGYFKQQSRWALGTVGLFRSILRDFLRRPRSLSPLRWWEYFLSGTYYFVGFVYFVLMLCPALYLLFSIPTYFAQPELYVAFFLPYFTLTLSLFIWTLRERHYRPAEILQGQLLIAISFPVYLKASLLALLGRRGGFVSTPKGRAQSLPLTALWPQLLMAGLNWTALVWGVHRLYFEREPVAAFGVNVFWCAFHFLILSSVLYFNRPSPSEESARAPAPATT
jgi:cellulose synthase (UDP-forming)